MPAYLSGQAVKQSGLIFYRIGCLNESAMDCCQSSSNEAGANAMLKTGSQGFEANHQVVPVACCAMVLSQPIM